MILTCELCQSQFLTESDPHVIIPGPETKIYCYCKVKGNEKKLIDMLKHDHNLFQKCLGELNAEIDRLKTENERLQNYVIADGYKQKELDELKLEYDKLTDWASEYVTENSRLNQEIEKFKGYLEAWGKDE